MKKFDWKPVKDFVELVVGGATYVLMIAAARKGMDYITDSPSSSIATYGDAVGAIMASGMYSHDKSNAVAALKRNGNSEFYKAIVHIAKDSSMYSHDKVNMIEALSKE